MALQWRAILGLGLVIFLEAGAVFRSGGLVSASGLPQTPSIDLSRAASNVSINSVLLTFRLRFGDGSPVPGAQAQLISQDGSQQLNFTIRDGSCSFQINPSAAHSLFLTAVGSANSAGSIQLNRPIAIPAFDPKAFNGVRNLGDITIPYNSFCKGTAQFPSDAGAIFAGTDPLHTLQVPNQTCTWILGPFNDRASITLYVQWFDLSSGNSLNVSASKLDGSTPQVALLIGPGLPNPPPDFLAVSVNAPQANIVFTTGTKPDALTYGFVMYYRVNYVDDTSPLLTVSLVWAGGGCLVIFIVFVGIILLRRRQRRRRGVLPPAVLRAERKVTSSAEPDPLDADVMLVKWLGEPLRRIPVPQMVWRAPTFKPHPTLSAPSPNDSSEQPGRSIVPSQDLPLLGPEALATFRPSNENVPSVQNMESGPEPLTWTEERVSKGEKVLDVESDPKQKSISDAQQGGAGVKVRGGWSGWRKAGNESLDAADRGDMACAICLVDYEEGVLLRPLPCGHAFHTACIDMWLKKDPSCPLCKRPLYSPPAAPKTVRERGLELSRRLSASRNEPGPSSEMLHEGQTSAANDLEVGNALAAQDPSTLVNSGDTDVAHEAHERAEIDERANRQRATHAPWHLHQWLAWGW